MQATASLPIRLDAGYRTPVAAAAPRRAAPQTAGLSVSRAIVPWRWRTAGMDALELIAVVWSLPFVIVAIGAPLALAVAALVWLGRWTLGAF